MSAVIKLAVLACVSGAWMAPGTAEAHDEARAGCTAISTLAQLSAIRNKPNGNYCLTKDIAATGNFVPIPNLTGVLDGAGHTISNLTIKSAAEFVGLFGQIDTTGIVRNLNFVDLQVTGTARQNKVGGLAGYNNGLISNVTLAGVIIGGPPLCDESTCFGTAVGGMVASNRGTITNSRVAVSVSKVNGSYGSVGAMAGASSGRIISSSASGEVTGKPASPSAPAVAAPAAINHATVNSDGETTWWRGQGFGESAIPIPNPRSFGAGLVFTIAGSVSQSFSTVRVRDVDNAAGLVSWNTGTITQSFSAGRIDGGTSCGGLVSTHYPSLQAVTYLISQSYSVTPVVCAGSPGAGLVQQSYSRIAQVYAVGPVKTAPGAGLVQSSSGVTTAGYFDPATTGQAKSAGGTPLSTGSFKAKLPAGFAATAWSITPNVSYPYLTVFRQRGFVAGGRLFLPIGQRDKFNYAGSKLPAYAADASLAASFAVIGRAIGINSPARRVANTATADYLTNATIDRFWQASTGGFAGPIASLITVGAKTAVAANASLNSTAVVSALRAGKVVLLHGAVTGKPKGHWVLATAVVENSQKVVTRVIAADPFTGGQVGIDPATKRIVASPAFTLPGFKVDAFQVVTVKP